MEHAKAWADDAGVTADAFLAEGVPPGVLRRAGFRGITNGSARRTRRTTARASTGRRRVSADEVLGAIPTGTFTVKDVQEASGASDTAVVRRVIGEEVDAGNVTDQGPDPDHTGPGRAPTVYQRQ